jgi:peptidoglycan-associated lipoprotein
MSDMKYLGRTICIPALFMLGACCCDKDVVVPPVAPSATSKTVDASAAVVLAPDIYFEFDRSAITDASQAELKTNAAWMAANPSRNVILEGHCDERGTREYNMALGDRRATAAKEYLVRLGVDPSRLKTISYGEEKPVDPGHNEEAWAKNRRVHFAGK